VDGIIEPTLLGLTVTVGISSAGIATLAPDRWSVYPYLFIMYISPAIASAMTGTTKGYIVAGMLIVGVLFLVSVAGTLNNDFWQALSNLELLEERAKELEKARDLALDADQSKSDFLAKMSHEIRTPMNGVLGMTELLQTTELSTRQREFTDTIRHSADSLLTVINDILDFSKIEAGKLEINRHEFVLRDTITNTMEMLAEHGHRKGLELISQVLDDVPARIIGDSARLRQILTNLLSNAVKFTDMGEVVLLVSNIEDSEKTAKLRFEVHDTGIGLPAELCDRVFESFSQADDSYSRRYGGTGLGLAIAKQLTALMSGEIGVTSEPGLGSCFWFTAPFDKSEQEEEEELEIQTLVSGKRVLVVDDNATHRRILGEQLSGWNMEIKLVEDGVAAIRCLNGMGSEQSCDLILLDEDMSGFSGSMTLRTLRNIARWKDVPVILMVPTPQEISNDGSPNVYPIRKPVSHSHLLACISQALIKQRTSKHKDECSTLEGKSASRLNLNILLAEDNEVNQVVSEEMLSFLGCKTITVANGLEVLRAFDTKDFDVILMDCQMPLMNGYEATRAIRKRESELGWNRIPVVALTANAMNGDRDKALQSGMDDFLSKPFSLDQLDAILNRFVSQSPCDEAGSGALPSERALEPRSLVGD
jgi:signal transduction histidine kinase/CheY-like chemotaxis protein